MSGLHLKQNKDPSAQAAPPHGRLAWLQTLTSPRWISIILIHSLPQQILVDRILELHQGQQK